MKQILSSQDFESLLTSEQALLYIFADWSEYAAITGLRIVEQAEEFFLKNLEFQIEFWLADLSDDTSPAAFIVNWLRQQESETLRLFPAIGTGSGSILWIRKGQAAAFALSASHLGIDGVIDKMKEIFCEQS